jgi:hypothetical protein
MRVLIDGAEKNAVTRLLLCTIFFAVSLAAFGQTPTNIEVASTVQQASVTRLGVNLGDNGYWDSAQIMKNLIFENPGFEGLKYRVIFHCSVVTADTCQDDNQWNAQPAGFWIGGSYRMISGNAVGATGTIVSNTAASTCKSCGPTLQFDKNLSLSKGDYFSVETYVPGAGDASWAMDTGSGGTVTTETTDLSPNTPGKQAMLLSANTTGQYAKLTQGFETWQNLSFIQLNGTFEVTFRAKGVGGNNKLSVSAQRLQGTNPAWLNQALTLTNAWQDYTLTFTANETGSAVGPVLLAFTASGGSAELDDVSFDQTNSSASNPTVFRDDVVNALKDLNPGVIRMMASGAALGSDIPNQLQVPFARYRGGFNADGTSVSIISYGIHEFLQLCQTVGSDPWITIPTSTTPQEMTDFIQYLTGSGSDAWSALRISRGQSQPWTSVFSKIHIELGNETWNGAFKGETMGYPEYPQWANQVFGAARQTTGFEASKFDLVLSGLAATPGYNQPMLSFSTQHDSFDIAPYLLYSANDEPMSTMFGALLAEPEVMDSAGGEVYKNMTVGATMPSATAKTTGVSVYETNLGTMIGGITQAELDKLTPSIGAGLAHTDHMLQMMRIGVQYQNAFSLPQYEYRRSDGTFARLWGMVVDMGTTNRRRPQFLTQALANSAIGGNMLQTTHTGANPTWDQPLSSDSVLLTGAHYLQSFAFLNNGAVSVVVFNLSQTAALPVTFSGANAPTGTVQMSQITSANITDSNEFAENVKTTTKTLSAFNPATGLSLPPFSMTVLTVNSSATQAPGFSVPAGSYSTAQSVAISSATPSASIYYTADGSTPTSSSTLYTGPVTVDKTVTLHAVAAASGLAPSAVSTAAYSIGLSTTATPAFSLTAGTYTSAQTVSIADATTGASIYYTTDGSQPTTSSAKYAGAIQVSATETVKAIAVATNYNTSAVASATYTISKTTATPAFSVAAGTYSTAQTVTLTDATTGATIYYTANGSTPTASSTKYSAAIKVSATETIKAIAVATGYSASSVASATYTIAKIAATPTFSIAAGTYTAAQTVSIKDTTTGSTIYYTTNGSTPTSGSTKYTSSIKVSSSETIKAIATATGYTTSAVASALYTITPVSTTPATATPTFSVAAGTYTTAQTVTLADATSGAAIYYTVNGSTPTTSSTKYTAAIKVSASETISAIALAAKHSQSAVATAAYTISATPTTGGFAASEMTLRGTAKLKGTTLELTDGGATEIAAAWYAKKVGVASFATDFTFVIPKSTADGFTFTLQNASKGDWESGGNGDALGYAGIPKSVAIKFDLYDTTTKSTKSTTGMLQNGASPTSQSIDMSSKLSLHTGHLMHAHLAYDGATLSETLTDTVTKAVFTRSYAVNIPSILGSSTALVGFTASTGRYTSVQDIVSWTYSGQTAAAKKK